MLPMPTEGRPPIGASSVHEVRRDLTGLDVARVGQIVVDPGTWAEGDWVPFTSLLDGIEHRVRSFGAEVGRPRDAVAASLLARSVLPLVVTPTAVAWSLFGAVPDLRASHRLVGVAPHRPVVVAMREPALLEASAERWATDVLDGVCGALIDHVREVISVGSRHLWGNVALAIAAPFAALLAKGHDRRGDRDLLLSQRPLLTSTVEILDLSADGRELEGVRRRTCCLLTKLPEPHRAMCGTCSLRPKDEQLVRLRDHYGGLAKLSL